jgi:hypothetical protein
LEDLCTHHNAFRWLRGGAPLNHHLLSNFLVEHVDFLEQLFTHSVTVLQQEGLVDLDRVGQDGMRVRASAGAASFHRRATLEKELPQAQAEAARQQGGPDADVVADADAKQEVTTGEEGVDGPPSPQQEAARQRHAEERVERLEQALGRMPEMEAKIKPDEDKEARVSTTDPEATVMKMPDGGYRPAYNVQFSTDCASQVVVGVDVVKVGNDQGQLPPMLEQIEGRFSQRPEEVLVDGGFVRLEDIEEVQGGEKNCQVYAPVPKPKKEGVERYEAKRGDSAEVAEWRVRMGTAAAKETYKQRGATAECVNAQAHNRGLVQLGVRGLEKVRLIALWFATAHNMARGFALLPQPAD